MRFYLGIDPGLSGAMAFYDPVADIMHVYDMPTHRITVNHKEKNALDLHQLAAILRDKAPEVKKGVVEAVSALPRQGVTSSFNFGFAAGCANMAMAACQIPFLAVHPSSWKRKMNVTKDKDACRREASRLMPKHAHNWPLVKHDGRAEAALLAYLIFNNEKGLESLL